MATTFRYDKTFEGLLNVVFDAYVRKEFPEALIGEEEPELMFSQRMHKVYTDTGKAERVWKSFRKKTDRRTRNMIMHVWLSEEPHSDELIFRYICKTFNSQHPIAGNFTDPDILEIKQIAMKVAREGEHVRQFIRFQKGGDGTFFAPTAPKYNVLPLAINYLKERFADQKWLVYDTKRHYGYYYDLQKVQEVTLEDDSHLISGKLDETLLSQDEKLFQEMWRSYFKAITIKERINPKLQRQNMPRRFWKYLTEKQ